MSISIGFSNLFPHENQYVYYSSLKYLRLKPTWHPFSKAYTIWYSNDYLAIQIIEKIAIAKLK